MSAGHFVVEKSSFIAQEGASRRIRVLWLIDSLTVGGAENLVVPFVRNVDRQRFEPQVCCLTTIEGNAIESELREEGLAILNLGARSLRDVRAFRRLLRFVRDHEINLIHAHLTYAAIWAALIGRITGVATLATLHVAPPKGWNAAAIRDRLMRAVLNRWSQRVVAVSDALRCRYLTAGGIDRDKMVTLHNGIEVARFQKDETQSRMAVRNEFGLPPDARIAVTVAVLRPGKGIDVLLSSISTIVQQVPETYFLIVGDGPQREEWSYLADLLGVADRVRWAGYRRDLDRILPGCDVFILPSLDDAFPTVLLEAMAAGLPVVASSVGGIPEIVADGVSGVLVPPDDAGRLAHAVCDLLLDSRTMARMRESARQIAALRFSTDAWITNLQSLYGRVIAESEAARS